MKRLICLACIILASLILISCSRQPDAPVQSPQQSATLPADTAAETTAAPAISTTAPFHSSLYVPGLSVEDVIAYFNEVCLDAEIINDGDPSVLQKWTTPIFYILYGSPTEQDVAVLSEMVQWLNTIPGFPGIQETTDPGLANLSIHFCSKREMRKLMGSQFSGMDGAVTFWYQNNEIYQAIICCRTDLDQELRNSVILEELYNGLGPVQDTALRPDSIIYSEFSQPQTLSEIDELILKLLYHPDLQCGMDAETCEAMIRCLYY